MRILFIENAKFAKKYQVVLGCRVRVKMHGSFTLGTASATVQESAESFLDIRQFIGPHCAKMNESPLFYSISCKH